MSMVPNTGIKASSPREETHPQNMTATCFLSSQKIKCGKFFVTFSPYLNLASIFYSNHSLI